VPSGDGDAEGVDFVLESHDKRFVKAMGLFSNWCLGLADKLSDATTLRLAALSLGSAGHQESKFLFSLVDVRRGAALNLRSDGYVDTLKDKAAGGVRTLFGVEYLRPRNFYEMTVQEHQLGLVVSKDMPLRVLGFNSVRSTTSADLAAL
jgi:hypothetical protein